jgi:DNA-directed RNA polymerase subunit H (RpoH/RPB5)
LEDSIFKNVVDEETNEKLSLLTDKIPEITLSPNIEKSMKLVSKLACQSHMQTINTVSSSLREITFLSETALKNFRVQTSVLDSINIIQGSAIKAVQCMNEFSNNIIASTILSIEKMQLPKIEFPKIDEETLKSWQFQQIISVIDFPVYFENGTELQNEILEICHEDQDGNGEYPIEEIKNCIYDYYDNTMLSEISQIWLNQDWIKSERKAALNEAIETYKEGHYYSTGSILMCQIGGLISELYEISDGDKMMPREEKQEILSLYNITKENSEKAKVIEMMAAQSQGIYLWYNSAEYFTTYIYSSSKDMNNFNNDPGRHKICHGEQTNYGTQEHALKSILAIDIIVQLGIYSLDCNTNN